MPMINVSQIDSDHFLVEFICSDINLKPQKLTFEELPERLKSIMATHNLINKTTHFSAGSKNGFIATWEISESEFFNSPYQ